MPEFTMDWTESIEHWPALFAEFVLVGRPNLRFLEIGCFEGRTTLWLLENVLTDPSSTITVVDTFGAAAGQMERFASNLAAYAGAYPPRVRVLPGRSQDELRDCVPGPERAFGDHEFDFIYVDGSHDAKDVLADAVLAWPLLKQGAPMVFDDYCWPGMQPLKSPGMAVDAFVACYEPDIAWRQRIGKDQFLVVKR